MRSKYFPIIFALLTAAWTGLGCTKSASNIDNSNLHIISDCVTPSVERDVQTSFGTIIAGGMDFTQFGFPQSTVHLGVDNSGPYNNGFTTVSRTCKNTYGDPAYDKFIFSCIDDGSYACSIVIIKQ